MDSIVWLFWESICWTDTFWLATGWLGTVWLGTIWLHTVWLGTVWLGMIWLGYVIWLATGWPGTVWLVTVWLDTVWLDCISIRESWRGWMSALHPSILSSNSYILSATSRDSLSVWYARSAVLTLWAVLGLAKLFWVNWCTVRGISTRRPHGIRS